MAKYSAVKLVGDTLVLDDQHIVPLPPELHRDTSARLRLELHLRRREELATIYCPASCPNK